MYCSTCGSEISAELNYCKRCGARVDKLAVQEKSTASLAYLSMATGFVGLAVWVDRRIGCDFIE